jgi:hypothetical protein
MRRIVESSKVIFVERNLGWSLLFLVSSIVALVIFEVGREQPSDPMSRELNVWGLVGFGVLFLAAFCLLFRKRAYVVDQSEHMLTIIHRRFARAGHFSCPLENVSIRMEQKKLKVTYRGGGQAELWVGAIWLHIKGKDRILFLDDLRGSDALSLAKQLSNDMGSPLEVIERNDWQ